MNHLNTIIVEGNVVRQAERSEPSPGFLVCRFPLAINRYYKDSKGETREEVSYIDVVVYGNYGESVAKNCVKGRAIRVVGKIKQDRWESSDGKKNSRIYIIAEHIEYRSMPSDSTGFSKKPKNDLDAMRAADTAALAEEAYEEAANF